MVVEVTVLGNDRVSAVYQEGIPRALCVDELERGELGSFLNGMMI